MAQNDAGYNSVYNLKNNDFNDNGYNLNSQYAQMPGFFDAYKTLVDQQAGYGSGDRAGLVSRLNKATDQFKSLFKNSVGREANDNEIGQFLKENAGQTISSTQFGRSENDPTGVRNNIANYIGDTFKQAAQDTATSKLSDLSSQAGGLADQYLEMGKKSLSSLSDSLKTYQTNLFDKLRPQLNLASQAGGFQDSGGQTLQEKGALTDLGNQAAGILIPYEDKINQNANAIRFGGASAPYSLASSFAANAPSDFSAMGQNALAFNSQNAMDNYSYQRQLQLMNAQRLNGELFNENTRPSFGYSLGNSFANNFGSNLASNFNGPNWLAAARGGSQSGSPSGGSQNG